SGSNCATGAMLSAQVPAELFDRRRCGLVALLRERGLEVGDQRLPELRVGLGPSDDLVDLAPGERQLLRRANPRFGSGRQGGDQLRQVVFVVCAHAVTCPPDCVAAGFLPSSSSRNLTKQREMRLAIVPAGSESASPIVR